MNAGTRRGASRAARRAVMVAALALAACAGRRGAGERPLAELAAGKMVELSGGTLLLGERTGGAHDVVEYARVGTFLLDVAEVTVAAYGECVRAGACTPAGAAVVAAPYVVLPGRSAPGQCNRDRDDRADHPVNCVDWQQAAAYCAWAGKRLPSEAEWEWAARNGREKTWFPWGKDAPAALPCWSGEGNDAGRDGRAGTCAAGSHPGDVTRAGVKDLAGGVWEWTSSRTVLGADSRGRGGAEGKVARGGSWSDADPRDLLATRRLEEEASRRDPRLGFRCASDR